MTWRLVGTLGGGVEVITEQVTVGRHETRTFNLPDGWEEGYVGAVGRISDDFLNPGGTILGTRIGSPDSPSDVAGFSPLPSEIALHRQTTWSGTVTMIKVS